MIYSSLNAVYYTAVQPLQRFMTHIIVYVNAYKPKKKKCVSEARGIFETRLTKYFANLMVSAFFALYALGKLKM